MWAYHNSDDSFLNNDKLCSVQLLILLLLLLLYMHYYNVLCDLKYKYTPVLADIFLYSLHMYIVHYINKTLLIIFIAASYF